MVGGEAEVVNNEAEAGGEEFMDELRELRVEELLFVVVLLLPLLVLVLPLELDNGCWWWWW